MIQTINTCQLACNNCYLENGPMPIREYMDFDTFQNIIDRCEGVENVHLTPIVGESTLHKDIFKQLDYLESKKTIKKVSMFTNFLNVDVKRLVQYKKLHLIISIYGSDKEMYLRHTNKDKFDLFEANMNTLFKSNFLNLKAIEFFMRREDFDYSSDLGKKIKLMVKMKPFSNGEGNFIYNLFWNGNWCGEMEVQNMRSDKKEGICSYAPINNSIDTNGDIILCGACDIKKTTKLGNIFEQDFTEIYATGPINRIFENQKKNIYEGCCANCSEFHR